jgi:RNA polymerase sigma-70 factor (ECF subfamily)
MCSVEPSRELVSRWRVGDQHAASELFERYWQRLVREIHPRISHRFRSKFDAEDVAQSAFGSFLHRTADGQYQIEHTGGLWQLLRRIAETKLQHRIEHHTAQKRSVLREASPDSAAGFHPACVDPAADATELLADFEDLLSCFSPLEREMIRLWLEGNSVSVVGTQLGRKRGSVDSVLKRFRQRAAVRFKPPRCL